mgnify:CR=1 FL=1
MLRSALVLKMGSFLRLRMYVVVALGVTLLLLLIFSKQDVFWVDSNATGSFSTSSGQVSTEASPSMHHRRKAAVYARPTFHEEVVSTMACMLHDEGFHVSIYVGSGLAIGRLNVPFSEKRKKKAAKFYGHCVDRWITITEPLVKSAYIPNLDLLIFSTYPILTHNFVPDYVALSLIEYAGQGEAGETETSVVLISHRTNETLHEQLNVIERHIPRERFTFVFLSEHTELTMAAIFQERGLSYVRVKHDGGTVPWTGGGDGGEGPYRLSHFFPIMPLQYAEGMGGDSSSFSSSFLSPTPRALTDLDHMEAFDSGSGQLFSVQGNFGGRHAHRKDVKGTVSCLRKLEEEDSRMVNLDLIGHVVGGKLDTGSLLKGKISMRSDLSSTDYYRAIANTHFMIVAVAEADYYCCRATSSVPAALIAGTPLVAQRSFLKYYPCLNTAPIHSLIAKDTECESIATAHKLTKEQYALARQEIANCSAIFYAEARSLWRELS